MMKGKMDVITIACVLFAMLLFTAAPSAMGEDDLSVISPGPGPTGLAYDGMYVWVADAEDALIYQLDTSGNIINSFYSPGSSPSGLAYDGEYLWNADLEEGMIYKLDTSGDPVDSFYSPGNMPTGLACDGDYLWYADAGEQMIYKLDTFGDIIDSFPSPGAEPAGLAFDGVYLWHADSGEQRIYKLDTSGNLLDNFYSPGYAPYGLAFDGSYLWNADTDEQKLYRVDTWGSGGTDIGYMVTSDLWIRAVIRTEEKGSIEAVWKEGGRGDTEGGDSVIWGHFYADPDDVNWGSRANPELFVKIWFDRGGRVDVNFFHVSVPDIEVYSAYPYSDTWDEFGVTTMETRYIRQFYLNGESNMDENEEDGYPPTGYSPDGDPLGYYTVNDLRIGALIDTEEKGLIDAIWHKGGQAMTDGGHEVMWGHFYASPDDVNWGDENNPDLFVKIWFDASGRVDVNYFHVSVPDIEVYSDLPDIGYYDNKGTTIMKNRYIRHEYWTDF